MSITPGFHTLRFPGQKRTNRGSPTIPKECTLRTLSQSEQSVCVNHTATLTLVPHGTEQSWLAFRSPEAAPSDVSTTGPARRRPLQCFQTADAGNDSLQPASMGTQERELSKPNSVHAHFLKAAIPVSPPAFWGDCGCCACVASLLQF